VLICAIGVGVLFVPQGLAPTATFLGVFVAMQGLFRGGIGPNMSAMIVEHIPKAKTGAGLGLSNSAGSVGFAVGPMIGAAMMAGTSMRAVFFFAASLYALVIVAMALLARRPESHAAVDEVAEAG
jgi:MFS family permease